jgi:ABC-type glutathione transport system ATPase component
MLPGAMPSITKSSKRTSTTIDQRARRERGRRASGARTPEERAAAAAERAAKRRPPKQRPRLRDRREAGKHAEGRRRTKLATLNRSERRPETDAPAHSPALVSFDNVFKEYAPGVGLNGASFDIAPGEFVFLVGATGSGKSTIMRLLTKELEPSGGRIEVAGRDLSHIPRKRVPHYRRNIGVIFQDFKLLPTRTVYENVAYALRATGHSRREIRAKVPDILRLTGLSTKLHNYPDELSGGEQQRVRQPPAAPARRRADRQPRSRDEHRDHAAPVPDQPHRHHRPRGHP